MRQYNPDRIPSLPYHIHVDATYISGELRDAICRTLGFEVTNFVGHPPGYQHFEPNDHLTKKLKDKNRFEMTWAALESLVQGDHTFAGYLEGERIVWREGIEPKPFDPGIPFPYKMTRRRLTGPPHETFRNREFHLTIDRDASDPRFIETLLNAGLYGAYLPKDGYTALVLTAQGSKFDIPALARATKRYTQQAGGAVRAIIKEEIAIRHTLIGITHTDLPEVVDYVQHF